MFKELLVPAGPGNATAAHHAKATTLRLALCELLERAVMIDPAQPLTCACGEVFETIDEMDQHLWDAFVPSNDIGLDGRMHGELATCTRGGPDQQTDSGSRAPSRLVVSRR
jgi:hypothetical protein